MMMKKRRFDFIRLTGLMALVLCTLLIACTDKKEDPGGGDPPPNPPGAYEGHPRILLAEGEETALMAKIEQDVLWKQVHQTILSQCQQILSSAYLVHKLEDHYRMLSVARNALKRMFFLSYAYRMTGVPAYLSRAQRELEIFCDFPDWNPQHFLDVAEFTMAAAIGYDWLYDDLSPEVRAKAHAAIRDKSLKPSQNSNYQSGWLKAKTNWNQVCHVGMAYGALALLEEEPVLARQILDRSKENIHFAMDEYAPDGAYPEGPGYWEYGTSFNAMYLAAIEKAFGTDYGLKAIPGFLSSGDYMQQMVTPANYIFNYADNSENSSLSPTAFWFYRETREPALLYTQKKLLESGKTGSGERLLPAVMLWGAGSGASMENAVVPSKTYYLAQGVNPVCVMRSGWEDAKGMYVGFKAGTPKVNHAHMDVGSFIFEAEGIRWGIDLGMEDYAKIEAHISGLFTNTQTSKRWDVFRYNNWAHSTLTFNDGRRQQLVDGPTRFEAWSDDPAKMYATVDLTPVYADQVETVKRGVALIDRSYVMVEDVITTKPREATKVRWNMTSGVTDCRFDEPNRMITLTKEGKTLYMKIVTSTPVELKTWSTTPPTNYEKPNEGTIFVGFETELAAGSTSRINVYLMPGTIVPDPLDELIE